jgi:hypothetical protein
VKRRFDVAHQSFEAFAALCERRCAQIFVANG